MKERDVVEVPREKGYWGGGGGCIWGGLESMEFSGLSKEGYLLNLWGEKGEAGIGK